MLPTNFDAFANERPELGRPIRAIDQWCVAHRALPVADPRRVALQFDELTEGEIASAFRFLVERGVFRPVYRVETSDGLMVGGEFASIADIPDELVDRFETEFARDDGEIVAVFKGVR